MAMAATKAISPLLRLVLVMAWLMTSLSAQSQVLSEKVTFAVQGKTRAHALHELSQQVGFDYAINPGSYASEEEITLTSTTTTVKNHLDRILEAPALVYKERNGVVVIAKSKKRAFSIQNRVFGVITDAYSGDVLSDVIVRDRYVNLSDTTDEHGQFELVVDQPDYTLTLELYKPDYFSREIVVKLSTDKSFNLSLTRIPPNEEPLYIYDSSRSELPFLVTSDSLPFPTIGRAARTVDHSIFEIQTKWAAAGIVPKWHTDPTASQSTIYRATADLIYGRYAGVKGISFAGLINSTMYHHDGLQIAGLVNHGQGKGGGIALAGLSNVSGLDFHGIQASGVFNYARVRMNGFQFAGIGNTSIGPMQGMQVAGVYSQSKGRSKGLQVAGVMSLNSGARADMIQVGGLLAVAGRGLHGIQFGGVTALANDQLKGAQFSVITNLVSGDMSGLQVGGFGSMTSKRMKGLQLSGLVNYAGQAYGAQTTFGFNTAGEMHGAQIGLVNITGHMNGFQLGIINIVDSLDQGVSIGLLNVVGNGLFEVQTSYEGTGFADLAIRTGSNSWYNILSFGYRLNDIPLYRPGYGLGFKVMPNDYVGVTVESQLYKPTEDWSSSDLHLQWNSSVGLEVRPLRRLAIFAAYNYSSYYTSAFDETSGTSDLDIAPKDALLKSYGQYGVQVWSTYTVGLRFL